MVKFYITSDVPEHRHEVDAVREIAVRMWQKDHPSNSEVYCVIAGFPFKNASDEISMSADVIVLSLHGIGVLELKNYSGVIRVAEEAPWTADGRVIGSGKNPRIRNPHEQVSGYADELQARLARWNPFSTWPSFRIDRAVCFTNPKVELAGAREAVKTFKRYKDCKILAPDDVRAWALAMRFGGDEGKAQDYKTRALKREQLDRLVDQVFEAREWLDLVSVMPQPGPYGFLEPIDGAGPVAERHILYIDEIKIGRGKNEIQIDDAFSAVSKQHGRITRGLRGVFVEDLTSKNGTFVNGKRISEPCALKHGDVISLGGVGSAAKTWAARYVDYAKDQRKPQPTTDV